MTLRKKVFVFAGGSFLLLLIALVIAVPYLVDVDRHRPRIAAYIEEQTGKPAEIGRLALTLTPTLSIRVDDFVLGNPEGFPKGDFFRARRIYAELDRAALWDRRVVIRALEINDPVIALLQNTRGKWNFENPPAPPAPSREAPPAAEPSEPAFTLGVIERVSITGAQVTAAKLVSPTETAPSYFEAANLAADLVQVNLNAFTNPQTASLSPAPPAAVILRREAPKDLLFRYVFPAVVHAQDTETAQPQPAASGALTADSLRFGSFEVTSVTTRIRIFPREVSLDDLNFGLYQGRAAGGLSFDVSGRNPAYAVAAKLTGVNIAALLESFPTARGKMTGSMDGDIELNGVVTNSPDPLAGASGTGRLSIRDGNLPTLDLNQNMMQLARFTQLGPAEGDPSSFSSITADFNIADQRIVTRQLHVVGNGVEITAAGSIAFSDARNLGYEGVANVAAGDNPVSNIVANLSGATFADGKLSFPFTLTGTLDAPNFRLRSATPANVLRGFQNLLGGLQQSTAPEADPSRDREGAEASQPGPGDLLRGLTDIFGRRQPTQQPAEPPPPQP
jgi:AsmA protein